MQLSGDFLVPLPQKERLSKDWRVGQSEWMVQQQEEAYPDEVGSQCWVPQG